MLAQHDAVIIVNLPQRLQNHWVLAEQGGSTVGIRLNQILAYQVCHLKEKEKTQDRFQNESAKTTSKMEKRLWCCFLRRGLRFDRTNRKGIKATTAHLQDKQRCSQHRLATWHQRRCSRKGRARTRSIKMESKSRLHKKCCDGSSKIHKNLVKTIENSTKARHSKRRGRSLARANWLMEFSALVTSWIS